MTKKHLLDSAVPTEEGSVEVAPVAAEEVQVAAEEVAPVAAEETPVEASGETTHTEL